MDWSIVVIVIQLIFLEGILSIDNAAVLGAMVTNLSDHDEIPWPKALHPLGRVLNPILGKQRTAALRVGLLGAYVGRGLMLFLATLIIQNPWLKILGAAYLIRLAFDNLGSDSEGQMDEDGEIESRNKKGASFWGVVLVVEMTDLIFSLDNVVAAVSLSDKFWVVILGVAIGILMMRFAAGLFSYAVEREPVLKTAAYILVLNIGIELLISEFTGTDINDWLRFGISIATILACLAYEHLHFLHVLRPVLTWIARGFARLNAVVDWVLEPFFAIFRFLWSGAIHILKPGRQTAD